MLHVNVVAGRRRVIGIVGEPADVPISIRQRPNFRLDLISESVSEGKVERGIRAPLGQGAGSENQTKDENRAAANPAFHATLLVDLAAHTDTSKTVCLE